MGIGKITRLHRIFNHPSGRFCSIAVDHFIAYGDGLPHGLRNIGPTLDAIVSAKPDAITMHKGIATSALIPHAGKLPLILQSTIARIDDTASEQIATVEDAVRFGADGFAVAAFIKGKTEAVHLRVVADCVRDAIKYDMPVICHIYPRIWEDNPTVSYDPEDIAWAVRCALEVGADVIKVPYCGEVNAYAEIIGNCAVPVVAAGGPRTRQISSALEMMADVVQAGARGATIGRNVWGFGNISAAVKAFKAVIHEGKTPDEALRLVGF